MQQPQPTSAWKYGPVWSFVKIWRDWDLDQSLQVEEPWKTGLNQCQPVQCSFGWFSMVERPVSTSFSLNWLRTGWGLVLWLLTTYVIGYLYYWAWYYDEVIPCSVSGEGESVHHHPLDHCCCHVALSSSAPLHHRPVAVFISCCYCHVASSSPKVAEGEGVMWQWLAGVDVVACDTGLEGNAQRP